MRHLCLMELALPCPGAHTSFSRHDFPQGCTEAEENATLPPCIVERLRGSEASVQVTIGFASEMCTSGGQGTLVVNSGATADLLASPEEGCKQSGKMRMLTGEVWFHCQGCKTIWRELFAVLDTSFFATSRSRPQRSGCVVGPVSHNVRNNTTVHVLGVGDHMNTKARAESPPVALGALLSAVTLSYGWSKTRVEVRNQSNVYSSLLLPSWPTIVYRLSGISTPSRTVFT